MRSGAGRQDAKVESRGEGGREVKAGDVPPGSPSRKAAMRGRSDLVSALGSLDFS